MSDYTRLRPAITHYENLSRSQHGAQFVTSTAAHFADMKAKYYSKNENPDYSSVTQKFCYLYKYAVAHGYYIFSALRLLKPKIRPATFSRNPTRIACIGGGPGTEIIGLCRYLREVEPQFIGNQIEITVFDREPSWEESCKRVLACVGSGLNISLAFTEFDATDASTYSSLDFSKFNLVTANFFASEIRKAKIISAAKGFWEYLFNSMGAGKVFLAIDFADANGAGWKYIDGMIPKSAITVLSHETLSMACPDGKGDIQALEAELDHSPKKNGQNFVRAVIT